MHFPRAAGVLLHPTSFPGRYGIGDLGDEAFHFVDFLADAKQSYWQVLPLGPTGYGDSPYQCFSAFAGNPLLISPDKLVEDGFLPAEALVDLPDFPTDVVNFGTVIGFKMGVLQRAYAWFSAGDTAVSQQQPFAQFCQEEKGWLDDYALFMALKNKFMHNDGGVWNKWPQPIAQREPKAMAEWSATLTDEIALYKFIQFLFFKQWLTLKAYANERNIKIIGDIPIFVAFDSADVWANPDLFYLDKTGAPTVVAGVPPDYFSVTGQRWGNPLYRWKKMQEDGYAWWAKRLKMSLTQADMVRIDHFRGFQAYWEIPAIEPTAMIGRWMLGPNAAFFAAMEDQLGELPLIAEDLGVITPEVEQLRDQFDFPGMKILQFAFGGERNSLFLPHNFNKNNVCYTGTHDNETVRGWYESVAEDERDHVRRYLGVNGHDIAWDMLRLALASVADTAVSTLQDLMDLGNEARMNFPGKVGGYWRWRYQPYMLNDAVKNRLRELTYLYGRVPNEAVEIEPEPMTIEVA